MYLALFRNGDRHARTPCSAFKAETYEAALGKVATLLEAMYSDDEFEGYEIDSLEDFSDYFSIEIFQISDSVSETKITEELWPEFRDTMKREDERMAKYWEDDKRRQYERLKKRFGDE